MQDPIVGGLPDAPGSAWRCGSRRGLGVHLRGLADELLVNDFPGATLRRDQREMIATAVSAENDCFFCMDSHGAFATALLERDGAPELVPLIDVVKTGSSDGLRRQDARAAAHRPHRRRDAARLAAADVEAALAAGATDADVQLAVLIASAFSMYNRLVDGFRAQDAARAEAYRERAGQIAEHGYSAPAPAPAAPQGALPALARAAWRVAPRRQARARQARSRQMPTDSKSSGTSTRISSDASRATISSEGWTETSAAEPVWTDLAVERCHAVDEVDVGAAAVADLVADGEAGFERGDEDRGVLMDPDGRAGAVAVAIVPRTGADRRHRGQSGPRPSRPGRPPCDAASPPIAATHDGRATTLRSRFARSAFVSTRCSTPGGRLGVSGRIQIWMKRMRLGLRGVLLRVPGARAERHPLHRPRGQRPERPAHVVLVAEQALDHVGETLDVPVRMERPDRPGHEPVVVEHAHRPEAVVLGILVRVEREVPARPEPAAADVVDLAVAPDLIMRPVNHRCPIGALAAARVQRGHPIGALVVEFPRCSGDANRCIW